MTLLTLVELKELVTTSAPDAALELLLEAAEEDIVRLAGPTIDDYVVVSATEYVTRVRGDLIGLARRASAIVGVEEHAQRTTPTTLTAGDYELIPPGDLLRRVGASRWHPDVRAEYVPLSDLARRKATQAALVRFDLTTNPALAGYQTGTDAETYAGDPVTARAAILAGLLETADGGLW